MTQETPEETNRRLRLGVYPPVRTLRDSMPPGRPAGGLRVAIVVIAVGAVLAVGVIAAVLLLAVG